MKYLVWSLIFLVEVLFLTVYHCVCVHISVHRPRSENNLWKLVLFFHHGSGHHTQFIKLVQRVLFPTQTSHQHTPGKECSLKSLLAQGILRDLILHSWPAFHRLGILRLTITVNNGKQQFQVVLCLLHQVPTLDKTRERLRNKY